ncbi:hypothetical protein [Nocardioides taihuensis]|uniref:Uncharacterized protein n=1 Tax=Nocardioides taihuensis TaxID=1835606 RepID=A0ABW0BJ71_9ACTN
MERIVTYVDSQAIAFQYGSGFVLEDFVGRTLMHQAQLAEAVRLLVKHIEGIE